MFFFPLCVPRGQYYNGVPQKAVSPDKGEQQANGLFSHCLGKPEVPKTV